MDVQEQIKDFIATHPEPKRTEVVTLHQRILQALPETQLWFDTGIDSNGKVVTNPTIGYGTQTIKYANGETKDYFQIGLSTNKSGISVYILGIADKAYLAAAFGERLGKASVTGYCVKFKKLADINIDVLEEAIHYGVSITS